MKNEIYGSMNYQNYMNDSSNHAKEGEGVFEMLQRRNNMTATLTGLVEEIMAYCDRHYISMPDELQTILSRYSKKIK